MFCFVSNGLFFDNRTTLTGRRNRWRAKKVRNRNTDKRVGSSLFFLYNSLYFYFSFSLSFVLSLVIHTSIQFTFWLLSIICFFLFYSVRIFTSFRIFFKLIYFYSTQKAALNCALGHQIQITNETHMNHIHQIKVNNESVTTADNKYCKEWKGENGRIIISCRWWQVSIIHKILYLCT